MSEFQKNERRKIVQNTKAIYMGKTPVFCVSCDKKINVLNEEIIIFQHCNHFLHFSCIDGENPKCKKCLQQTKSIKNNVIRYKQ